MDALDLAIIMTVFVVGLAGNLILDRSVRRVIGVAGIILTVVFVARYITAFTISGKMQQGLLFSQLLTGLWQIA